MIRIGTLAIAALLLIAAVAWAGILLRAKVWDWTTDIRFNGDIENGFRWGGRAYAVGFLNVYDIVGDQTQRGAFDYAPLRLGVMTAWVAWLDANGRDIDERLPDRAYHAPLLYFNTAIEALAAIGAFVLVRHVRLRWRPCAHHAATAYASIAALLVWFNPASILEAHGWPQWDVWPMPFFLFALYCGLRRWWLTAGVLIGIASMLKGQILVVAWVLPVWALFLGDWRGALRLIGGAVTAILLTGTPWIISHYDPASRIRTVHPLAVALITLTTLCAALLPRRFSPAVVCWTLAATMAISMHFLGGTDYWLECSFGVGQRNYPQMIMGTVSNVPAILKTRYGWRNIEMPVFTWPTMTITNTTGQELLQLGGVITIRTLLLMTFAALSLASGIRAAALDRRGDPRVVVALALPWLFFYLLPCQIHERYLLFAAVCSGTWIAAGARTMLLGLLISLVAFAHILLTMLQGGDIYTSGLATWRDNPFGFLKYLLTGISPGIAWMLMLCAAVLFYGIFPRREPQDQ